MIKPTNGFIIPLIIIVAGSVPTFKDNFPFMPLFLPFISETINITNETTT